MTKQTKPRARSTQSTLWLVVLLVLVAFYFFYTRQTPQPAVAPPDTTATVAAAAGDAVPATEVQPASAAVATPATTAPVEVTSATAAAQPQAVPRGARATATRAPPTLIDGLPTIMPVDLPREALETLARIESAGPFPFSRDGVVFQNRERLLPRQPEGYYHEYTVITPGSSDRGARRIIAGETGERYYTDDHYTSFFVIVEVP